MVHASQQVSVRIIEAFIKRDPSTVQPQHRRLQPTENGGHRWVVGTTGPHETVRFVPSITTTEKTPQRVTPDGRTVYPSWKVICLPDSQVGIGDLLPWGTSSLEVVYRATTPSWRVVFEAVEHDG
jgi:hypothetical protein